ncbi:hypothetical protein PUMCH_004477 [Australozyma saopauloensis]|uniref:DNA mismatch repair proteins mutS family domain-containing protein n=1 Tax=Australozyma saopauloensis TaxID=291208 RepID=A0AAX4HEX3_9ASCO|nr:hypothetical protein PUMCH_004477 [[Candida] saopauloensis]
MMRPRITSLHLKSASLPLVRGPLLSPRVFFSLLQNSRSEVDRTTRAPSPTAKIRKNSQYASIAISKPDPLLSINDSGIADNSTTETDQEKICPSWDRGGQTKQNALTPLYSSIRSLMNENKGNVCLVQVGSFYELYFEQATLIAPKLGIKVATRQTTNHAVPMAGFPLSQLQKNVKTIVQDLQLNVAIIDQYNTVRTDTDLKHRKVSRIVSPGTLVDESFMNFTKNNYLVAISIPPNSNIALDPDLPIGLLWADVSVGEFYIQQTTLSDLASDLRRISPSEIILSKDLQGQLSAIEKTADLKRYFVRYHKVRYMDQKLKLALDAAVVRKFVELISVREEAAMNLILSYMTYNLPDRQLSLEIPTRFVNEKYLSMDPRTREALELSARSTFGTTSVTGTLWLVIKHTVTQSGTRLLNQWINLPLLDVQELVKRQEYVALFKNNQLLRLQVTNVLRDVNDFARALQKLALKTGSAPNHLQSISDGLHKLQHLHDILAEARQSLTDPNDVLLVDEFLANFKIPADVTRKIASIISISEPPKRPKVSVEKELSLEEQLISAIENKGRLEDMYQSDLSDDSNTAQSVTFLVRKDYDDELAALHEELEEVQSCEAEIFDTLHQIARSADGKGFAAKKDKVGKHYHVITVQCGLKQLSTVCKNILETKKFQILEKKKTMAIVKPNHWAEHMEKREMLTNRILSYERKIIEGLRVEVLARVVEIRNASRCSDMLDILSSFAKAAQENNWVRPTFSDRPVLEITSGRHPVVEANLKDNSLMFVPNETNLGADGNIWVILGPNMGGKSTFLRQNALIVILAQMGSFVPAESAHLGVVDRLFTRIGASDDLFSDLSTFMVEMKETSNILNNATPRSLAIVDEIGRGTSGKEGLAIAYATLLSLAEDINCRTLFATHYGSELTKLLKDDNVDRTPFRFFKSTVANKNGVLTFDFHLQPGISDRSYAIEIARLAGFPNASLQHAQRAQSLLK